MRITYPEAYFTFIDVTAIADSMAISTTVMDFTLPELFRDNIRQSQYGTMELNQFILDGSMEVFPASPEDIPFWSSGLSDGSCGYAGNPVLEVHFTEAHSSIGLSLHFAEDIPAEILVSWYTLHGTQLTSKTFRPDSKEYFCRENVQDYGGIAIEIIKSSWPYRYAKMDYIEYGQKWMLSRDRLKTATVHEEMDPTSATLSINTAQIGIIDTKGEFSILNESGLWKSLQKGQEIKILVYIDGKVVDCGTFFLDTWESSSSLVKFYLIDPIGVMDKTKYYGGTVYNKVRAGIIIDSIMASCGIAKYYVDTDIYNTLLSGWIGIQSHRTALQKVVFAAGAVADCSRSDSIRIYRPERHVSYTIGVDRKFMGAKIALDRYVSGVTVAYRQYSLSLENKNICKSILPAGDTRIEFSGPYLAESITVSTGIIMEARTNYVIIRMAQEAECIVSGQAYEAIENAYTASLPILGAGELEQIKSYAGCTVMDAEQAKRAANYLLDYYQLRQEVDLRYINNGEGVGNWCDIEDNGSHSITGITSQTLDLSGGNIATAKCRGYSRTVTSFLFTGTELYSGEKGVI